MNTHFLSTLAQSPADLVKQTAENLLETLEQHDSVEVLKNRTGIVMLPYTDTAHGAQFHVGEVLIAEAHVRLSRSGVEGYGAVTGRDTAHALAVAIIDAARRADIDTAWIDAFVTAQQRTLDAADIQLRQTVERTRVDMETF
jgi:alpha-D-ribose 1-methylphosphonate 5-triphosphate synthase subunit PhnG